MVYILSMKRISFVFFIIILIIFSSACLQKNNQATGDVINNTSETITNQNLPSTIKKLGSVEKELAPWANKTYSLLESTIFYDAPNGDKIINPASGIYIIGIDYIKGGTDCRIRILDLQDEWAKVQVIDPGYLSDTHIGWVPTKSIVGEGFTSQIDIQNNLFKIIKQDSSGSIINCFVVYIGEDFSKRAMSSLVSKVRAQIIGQANIFIFANEQAAKQFESVDDSRDNYLFVADNYICMSTFDAPLSVMMYPYQDVQYKEFGGKNWKKEPI